MLEQLKYINHQNEVVEFGVNGVFANYNGLRDFNWKTDKVNNKFSRFYKEAETTELLVTIQALTEQEGISKRNTLFEIMEKDVLANQHGRFIIGDYYLKCFITGSKKSDYLVSKRHLQLSLTVSTDYPSWIKETTTEFNAPNQPLDGGKNFDFNFDFAFDFTSSLKGSQLNNQSFFNSDFKVVIYGPVINPTIYIAGHEYTVNQTIEINEYLTINSQTKKIYLTKQDGSVINCFSKRNKESYIFEPISPGNNSVNTTGKFGFSITLLEERSEPKWT